MAFPATALPARVYLDPGGNPATPDEWVWTDVTDDVRVQAGITIEAGRGDEADRADPGRCTLVFDNRSGNYGTRNPLGQWYGLLAKNTPLRVALAYVDDAFGRTVSNGWGSADTGEAWDGVGAGGSVSASDFNVASGKGTHSVPAVNAYRLTWLSTLALLDADVTVTVTLPFSNVTGGAVEPANILLRMQDDVTYYMARVSISTAEAVSCTLYNPAGATLDTAVVAGLTHSSSQALKVRAQIIGSTLRMKVWAATGDEPAGWHASAVDRTLQLPGAVGVRSGVGSGNTNTLPIVFSYDEFHVEVERFVGTVPEWPVRWDKSANDCTAPVVAAGILRRLQQGQMPLRSAAFRAIAGASPRAYWPAEDSERATEAVSPVTGVKPLRPVDVVRYTTGGGTPIPPGGAPKFAQGASFGGSGNLPDFTDGGTLRGTVPTSSTAVTEWAVEFVVRFNTGATIGGVGSADILHWYAKGTYGHFNVNITNTGIDVFHSTTMLAGASGSASATINLFDGTPHVISYLVGQNGGNYRARLYVDGNLHDTADNFGSAMAGTVGAVTVIDVNPLEDRGDYMPIAMGHFVVWNTEIPPINTYDAIPGWFGETADERIIRICDEEGIPLDVPEIDTGMEMGAQPIATALELLQQGEDADGGQLQEFGGGLRYVPRTSRYNRPVGMALDFDDGDVAEPPEPTDDDQGVRNDWTVQRLDGGEAQFIDQDHIDLNGRYDDSITLNVKDDFGLENQAAWRVHLGTSDAMRWPRLTLNLAAQPGLIPDWLACGQGSRITVANAPDQVAARDVDVIVEGYTEYLAPYDWRIDANCSPAELWDVFEVEDANLGRIDSSTSVLNSSATSGTTSLSVAITGALWSTTEEPWDIEVGGERMTVTAVTGASSPQTFTVTRAVNGIVKAHAAGTRVRLWRSGVAAL